MGVSVTPIITTRKDKDGLYPIKIRVTTDRKSQYFPIKISVKRSEWSKSKRRVKTNHPDHLHINNLIESKLRDLEQPLSSNKPIIQRTNVIDFVQLRIEELNRTSVNTAKKYQSLLHHLKTFRPNGKLHFHDIDKNFILNFRDHLETTIKPSPGSSQPSNNTVGKYLKALRAIVNLGVEEGRFFGPNPFTKGVIPHTVRSNRRSLSTEEVQKLNNLEPVDSNGMTKGMWDSLSVFMFAFWSQGLRIGDILQLRYSDIHRGQFVINMEKTNRVIWVPINNYNLHRILPYLPTFPRFQHSVYSPDPANKTPTGIDIENYLTRYYSDRSNLIGLMEKEVSILWRKKLCSDKYVVRFDKEWDIHNPEFIKEFESLDYPWITQSTEVMIDSLTMYRHSGLKHLLDLSNSKELKHTYVFPHLRGYENSTDVDRSKKISSLTAMINKNLKKVCTLLDISPITTHTSRHSFTTLSKEMGSDIYDLKRWLGHTSVKTTEGYIQTLLASNPNSHSDNLKRFIYGEKVEDKG